MAAGEFNANRGENQPQPEDRQTLDPSVLEDVLKETIATEGDTIQGEQFRALQEVARRHANRDFDLDPVVVDLTEAILSVRYKAYSAADEQWREMSRQVAESLFEADNVRARIESLWNRLCESVR